MGNQIDALQLKNAFLAGANNLNAKKEWINELNVFPVPDGDTGTNMTMTIMSAAREVAAIDAPTLENVAKAMASGSLRGARGNSGVILSQLIRGFTKEIREHADEAGIDNLIMARAFSRAVETAYKAVMKPKEGTILTVAKGMADRITELSVTDEDLVTMLEKVVAYGDEVLAKTPEMLPVLKEAGVVDSGGQGLMTVVKGALASLKGEEVTLDLGDQGAAKAEAPAERKSRGEISTADIKFGYCTEFMVNGDHEFTDEEVDSLREWLGGVGDSIVCFSDENIIKVHVHTNHPGNAFEKGLTMGYLSKMKVDNMRLEHHEVLIEDASKIAEEEKKEEAAPAAAPEKPAEPATNTIPQGITAMISFSPDMNPEENLEAMKDASQCVRTGEITYAVRNTTIDGHAIEKDDIMALGDDGLLAVAKEKDQAVLEAVKAMVNDESEIITIYYGQDIPEEEAEELAARIRKAYPQVETELQYGGQPIYYYVISVE